MRKKRPAPNEFVDSDEEFDSVSMADHSAFARYFPRKQPRSYEPPANAVSVDSGSDKSTEKRGFGRGVWIRQMMEQKNAAPRVGSNCNSVRSDESSRSRYDLSSDFSFEEQSAELIETYRNDPHRITEDFGRGRGAIFRTLIHD